MKKTKNYVLTPESYMSEKERRRLLQTCKEKAELDSLKGRITYPTRYMLVDLALFSGLRVAEMASLKIGDFNLSGNEPYLIVRNGKGNKKRTVYLDNELKKHLKEYISFKGKTLKHPIDNDAPLFPGRDFKHCPPITLMKSFKVALSDAGLPMRYSIHKCRHTYATFLLRDTGNLKFVQNQLGHASLSMTCLYASILPEENSKLANSIKRE